MTVVPYAVPQVAACVEEVFVIMVDLRTVALTECRMLKFVAQGLWHLVSCTFNNDEVIISKYYPTKYYGYMYNFILLEKYLLNLNVT